MSSEKLQPNSILNIISLVYRIAEYTQSAAQMVWTGTSSIKSVTNFPIPGTKDGGRLRNTLF